MDPFTIGATLFNIGSNIFGQQQQNNAVKDAQKAQKKQNQAVWDYWWDEDDGEAYRRRDFQVEGIDRDLRNFLGEAETQIGNIRTQREYQDYIQEYGHQRNMMGYNKQVDQVNQQLGFNNEALERAFGRQDNYLREQQLGLEFQGRSVMLDYLKQKDALDLRQTANDQDRFYAYKNNRLNQKRADLTIRSQRAEAAFRQQDSIVEGLEQEGAARNQAGSGRSAGKTIQAVMAKNGAQRAQIASALSYSGEQYLLSTRQNIMELQKLNDDYILENAKIGQALGYLENEKDLSIDQINASYASLEIADNIAREDLLFNKRQADANVVASLPLIPELGPLASDAPLPEIYIPEMSYPMEINPPPLTDVIGIQPPSPFMAGLNSVAPLIGNIASTLGKNSVPTYPWNNQTYSGTSNFGFGNNSSMSSNYNFSNDFGMGINF
jgi:hypothetical protein